MNKSKSKTVNDANNTPDGIFQDPGRRYPTITSSTGYESLSYLDEEDKRIGVQIFEALKMFNINGVEQPPEHAAFQERNLTYIMYSCDPKLYANYGARYEVMLELVCGLNNQELLATTDAEGRKAIAPKNLRRYDAAMLMVIKVGYELDCEWTLGLMGSTPAWTLTKQQFLLLGHPESSVWDDEQRLILEYTGAVVNRTVSDELFERAENFWGRLQLLRYNEWICHYVGLITMGLINVSDTGKKAS